MLKSAFLRSFVLLLFSFMWNFNAVVAQCAYNSGGTTAVWCTLSAPTITGTSISCSNMWAGEIFRVTNMTANCTYRISTCGQGYDTQLTIFPQGGGPVLAYNDDNGPACTPSLQASIDFTPANNGTYDIKLNEYNCIGNQTFTTITVTLLSCPSLSACPNTTATEPGVPQNTAPPCGTYGQAGVGSGTRTTFSVVNNATYEFETCLSSFNTQLTGYNLGNNTVVFFNDDFGPLCASNRASVSWTSNFSGTLGVIVNEFNCSGYTGNSMVLRYRQVNNLQITSSNAAMCPGETRTLTATPPGGTFSGTGVSGNVFTAPTGVPSVTISYTLGTCTTTQVIDIRTPSEAPTGATASVTSYCSGAAPPTITLNAVGGTLGTGAIAQWFTGSCGGTQIGTGTSITVAAPGTTTTYFVRYAGVCNTTSCASVTVTVNPTPSPPTSAVSSANNYCATSVPSSITLQASGGDVAGGVVRWYTSSCGGVLLGTGNPFLVTPAPTSTTTYFVRYETASCGNTSCASVTVTVNTPSVAPTSATANGSASLSYCLGSGPTNISLQAGGGTLGSDAVVRWYSGSCGGTLVGTGNPLTISAPTSSTTYFARYESPSCGNTACASVSITVSTPSSDPTGIGASSTLVCPGQSVTLTVQGGSLGTGAQWEWYATNCGGTPIGTGSSITVNPTVTTTYFVRAVSTCGNTNCAQITINTKTLSTDPTGISTNNNNFCPGASATLSVVGGSLGTGANWVWYQGTCCVTPIGTGTSIVVSPSTTTTYFVRAEGDCNTTNAQSITLNVKTQSTPPSSITASRTIVCITNNLVSLSLVGGSLGTGAQWEWYEGSCPPLGGTLIATSTTTINVAPVTTTTYYVRANGDCGATACISITIQVSSGVSVSLSKTDVSCFGGSDGTATATATSGISPFSYLWSNGQTTQTATGLAAGAYSVTVTDAGGCTTSGTVNISQPTQLQVTNVTQVNVLCGGTSTGQITVSAAGGTPPYQFSINNGSTYQVSNIFTGLPAGNYTVLVQDTNGCVAAYGANPVIITENPPLSVTATSTDASCAGVNDGTVTVTSTTGGVPPYQYSLNGSPFQPSGNFTGLSANTYTVLVQDINGCQATTTVVVSNSANITLNILYVTNVSCFGFADGAFEVVPNGGIGPYSYTINGFTYQPTGVFSGLSAGTYNVLVVDARGCQATTTVTITQPPALFVNVSGITHVGCFGANSGSVSVNVSGGTAPYSFSWSNGQTTQTATGLTAGVYTVTVTDNNACTASVSATVNEAPQLFLWLASLTNVSCNGGSDGKVDITVSGGTPPYSFVWSNGATTEDILGLTQGTYSVVITDANGCTVSNAFTVTEPSAFTLSASLVHPDCNANATGSIDLTVSGATPPYSYLWSNFQTSEDISGLVAGTYVVIVTDANGCTTSSAYTLVDPTGVNGVATTTPVTCPGGSDGSIDFTPSGGNPPYSFIWSNGATTEDISGLTAGAYTVTLSDNNGCRFIGTYIVTQPAPFNVTAVVTDANCSGSVRGAIDITVTGGSPPYTYSWSNGATTEDINLLLAGSYTVTINDANGCTTTLTESVSQTNGFALTGTVTNVSCFGANDGSIVTSVINFVFPVTYAWSNGATTPNLFNIGPGTYNVSATDGQGCIAVETFVVTEPTQILITLVDLQNADCATSTTGSIDVSVTGGTLPYSYLWSNGATTQDISGLSAGVYILSVSDANGCNALQAYNVVDPSAPSATSVNTNVSCHGGNDGAVDVTTTGGLPPYTFVWNNGATTEDISGLSAGLYNLVITDENSCQYQLGVNITQPLPIVINFNVIDGNCGGVTGSITAVVSGGTPGYNYFWSNGAPNSPLNANLPAGTYTVTVSDANGCTGSASANISQSGNMDVQGNVTHVSCNGLNDGAISTFVINFTPPLTYAWSNGATTASINFLPAGSYTVTVTDGNNCIKVKTFVVTQPAAITITANTLTNPSDCAASDGAIDINVSGGAGGYIYSWTNGATTQDVSGLLNGTYGVVVTDANGCTSSASFTITAPGSITVTGVITNVSCKGANNGSIDITPSGGLSSNYTFTWSNGATTEDISGLAPGAYTVTVYDNVFCTSTYAAIVTEPSAIQFSLAVTDGDCQGASGSIDLSVAGGTPGYTYTWSNGATSQDIVNLTAGTYTVTITDANGCTEVASANVSQAGNLDVLGSIGNATCFGASNGSIITTVVNGAAPFTFAWSNGAATPNLLNVSAGTYTVTLTDANGCIKVKSFVVGQPSQIIITLVNLQNSNCALSITGSIDISVSGGAGGYTYVWTNGATTQDISNLIAGSYTVIVTDVSGCTATASFTITDPSGLTVTGVATQITCFGANNGSINVSATGGTPGYSYLWSNGATTQFLTGLTPGPYSVTVTDAANCQATAGFVITQPAPLTLANVNTNVNCHGASTGTIDLVVNGGTVPFTYSWSNGATTEDLVNIPADTYSVTVTDANGCTASRSVNLSQPNPLSLGASIVNVACNGGNNGSIQLTVSGGFAPYTYLWSNSATTQNLNNLAPGTYTVTVTDANNCTSSQSFNITAPAPLVVSTSGTNADCVQGILGSVNATITGGTLPYIYLWNNFATTEDISNLYAGTYILTVTDGGGCTATGSFTVVDVSNTLSVTGNVTDASCPGSSDGAISTVVSGGTPPITYTWNTGATTSAITGLVAGNYAVTVLDAQGCGFFAGFTVNEPNAIVINGVVVDGNCGGLPGSIDLTVSGGLGGPYGFQWSNGANTEDLTNVFAGTYYVTVTDAGGCTATAFFTVSQAGSLNVIAAINHVSCHGGADGQIFTTTVGGVPPYAYQWSTGDLTADLLNVPAGSYIISVTDANGCIRVTSFTVNQATPLLIAGSAITNAGCFGAANGAVDITVIGGTSPYAYLWSNFAVTQDIVGVTAGAYSVVVTDAAGCTVSGNYIITEPSDITIAGSVTNVSCFGGNDGSVSLTVGGGTSPYSYFWSNGSTGAVVTGLSAGIVSVTVSDANGCQKTAQFTITQPSQLLLNAAVTNVLCHGASTGSINLTVFGGTLFYSYLWSNGATTEDLVNLPAGSYTVTVTDGNGCTIVGGPYAVNQPASIQVTPAITNVSCFGLSNGAISVTVSGGTPGYTYSWSNGATAASISGLPAGNYTVTVTDAANCVKINTFTVTQPAMLTATAAIVDVLCFGGGNGQIDLTVFGGTSPYLFQWSNAATTEDLTNLAAGTYSVTIRDANNCTFTNSYTITQPTPLVVTYVQTNVLCFGGSNGAIDVTVTGGTPNYTYSWNDGITTQDRTGLTAGAYVLTVTDNNGCQQVISVTITQPALLTISENITDVSCNGGNDGAITLTVTGGTPPYFFVWSNMASSQNLAGLTSGVYNVTVTDLNGCVAYGNYTVNEPGPISALISVTNVSCFGGSDGALNLSVQGGTPGYSYLWSNGATSEDLNQVGAGTYCVTVTDANGCTAVSCAVVTQPAIIAASVIVTDVTCSGGSDGALDITVTGGNAPYSYSWSSGQTTQDISGLPAGIYTVTVIDANNCGVQFSFVVSQPDPLFVSVQLTLPKCYGEKTGAIDATAYGGTSPYQFQWSNGATTEDLNNLPAGVYTVTLTDARGCQYTNSFDVIQPDSLSTILIPYSASCSGSYDGAIDLIVSGGTQPYSFFWSTWEFTQNISNVQGGRYVVIVTDANGCTKIDSVNVYVPDPLLVVGVPKGAGCGADANGEIGITVSGGTPPYLYLWSHGPTTEDVQGLQAGLYTVTVTDAKGCSVSDSWLVSSLPKPIVGFTFDNVCLGEAALFINNTQLASGTLSFSWDFGNGQTSNQSNPSVLYQAPGTYTVKLVAESDKGCLDSLFKSIIVYELPDATITVSGSTPGECAVDTAFLSVPFDSDNLYLWSNGATTSSIYTTVSNNFRVTVTNAYGCVAVDAVDVFVLSQGSVSVSNDTTISLGFSVQLFATGGAFYSWTPAESLDNPNSATPIATPSQTTTYTVEIRDRNDCRVTRQVTVTVIEDFRLMIPNLFSPNGDGINDVWRIFNVETYPKTSVIIFNRWGNKVWESDNYDNSWDGTSSKGEPLPDGTYFYIIKVGGSSREFKGDVNILR